MKLCGKALFYGAKATKLGGPIILEALQRTISTHVSVNLNHNSCVGSNSGNWTYSVVVLLLEGYNRRDYGSGMFDYSSLAPPPYFLVGLVAILHQHNHTC